MKISECIILILDDDSEVLQLAAKILEVTGVKVLTALSVSQALDILKTKKPHLIITDLQMLPIDGFQFISMVKHDKNFSSIPVFVLSSYNDKESVFKAISLGADDYIVKPLNSNSLIRKVRKGLRDSEFLSYEFPKQPKVQVSVSCSVHSVSEVGLKIESAVCFQKDALVKIKDVRPAIPEFDYVYCIATQVGQRHYLKGVYITEFIAIPAETGFSIFKEKIGYS